MKTWWQRWSGLRRLGILGMNQRNAACILDLNPRSAFPVVDSKHRMRDLCAGIGVPTPAIYASVAAHSALRQLPRLLAGRESFVIKPDRGAGGRGILVIVGCESEGVFTRHNGQRLPLRDLRQHVSGVVSGLFSLGSQPDTALIQQRVLPHTAFETLTYQGIPDVRIIVYRRVPAMAMLRLPTRQSDGRANLHQGGIGAGIDLDSGITHHAVQRHRLVRRHPDTGTSLLGFRVPAWHAMLDMARRVAGAVDLGYLGVDIVLDRDQGPLLLEGNARPGLAIQIANGQGLLPRLEAIDHQLAGSGVIAPATPSAPEAGSPRSSKSSPNTEVLHD
jgi:alpha-L-glutamate ligase-like protein